MSLKHIKPQIAKKEEELKILKEKLETSNEWIYIKELGIKIQKKANEPIKKEKLIIPKNCRIPTACELGYCHDKVQEVKITTDWEVVKSFSQKNENEGRWFVFSLYLGIARAVVNGYNWDDNDYAFGGFKYRWVREVKK